MAAEEMIANIIRHGGKSVHWIDVNLSVEETEMRLRIGITEFPLIRRNTVLTATGMRFTALSL